MNDLESKFGKLFCTCDTCSMRMVREIEKRLPPGQLPPYVAHVPPSLPRYSYPQQPSRQPHYPSPDHPSSSNPSPVVQPSPNVHPHSSVLQNPPIPSTPVSRSVADPQFPPHIQVYGREAYRVSAADQLRALSRSHSHVMRSLPTERKNTHHPYLRQVVRPHTSPVPRTTQANLKTSATSKYADGDAGGVAYDHDRLPRIVAVHSIIHYSPSGAASSQPVYIIRAHPSELSLTTDTEAQQNAHPLTIKLKAREGLGNPNVDCKREQRLGDQANVKQEKVSISGSCVHASQLIQHSQTLESKDRVNTEIDQKTVTYLKTDCNEDGMKKDKTKDKGSYRIGVQKHTHKSHAKLQHQTDATPPADKSNVFDSSCEGKWKKDGSLVKEPLNSRLRESIKPANDDTIPSGTDDIECDNEMPNEGNKIRFFTGAWHPGHSDGRSQETGTNNSESRGTETSDLKSQGNNISESESQKKGVRKKSVREMRSASTNTKNRSRASRKLRPKAKDNITRSPKPASDEIDKNSKVSGSSTNMNSSICSKEPQEIKEVQKTATPDSVVMATVNTDRQDVEVELDAPNKSPQAGNGFQEDVTMETENVTSRVYRLLKPEIEVNEEEGRVYLKSRTFRWDPYSRMSTLKALLQRMEQLKIQIVQETCEIKKREKLSRLVLLRKKAIVVHEDVKAAINKHNESEKNAKKCPGDKQNKGVIISSVTEDPQCLNGKRKRLTRDVDSGTEDKESGPRTEVSSEPIPPKKKMLLQVTIVDDDDADETMVEVGAIERLHTNSSPVNQGQVNTAVVKPEDHSCHGDVSPVCDTPPIISKPISLDQSPAYSDAKSSEPIVTSEDDVGGEPGHASQMRDLKIHNLYEKQRKLIEAVKRISLSRLNVTDGHVTNPVTRDA
ncbi:uncharacterized protein LOC5503825 isoform X1 [Nematostella vectensis]|uniref:uncharacterized protein LOC5503825 isoform X1 n=1 Tax=Nematostella vectensis TaxID=45351 RepID=UPI002077617B|nr:uncharacterized protein LOC5503825 isoform X1 [Nematostella vectensis]